MVKTGKGVFYAHPIQATLTDHDSTPMGVDDLYPMGLTVSQPMGSSGPIPKEILIDTTEDATTEQQPAPYEQLSAICREVFGAEPDQQILGGMVTACHQRAIETTGQPATEDELIYFASMRAQVIRKAPNIRNHIAVLRKALPECFTGATFRAYRSAAIAQQSAPTAADPEAEARHRLWTEISDRHKTGRGFDMKAVAEDAELDEIGKQQARHIVQRLGRFTETGL